MSLNEQTMMGVFPTPEQKPFTHFSSPKLHPCVTSIERWNKEFLVPLQRNLLGFCGARNGDGASLLLPDPCDSLKKCLQTLEPAVRKHFTMMRTARELATKHEIKWMEAKRRFTNVDYQLACLDGRLKVTKTREPNLKSEKPSNVDVARKARWLSQKIAHGRGSSGLSTPRLGVEFQPERLGRHVGGEHAPEQRRLRFGREPAHGRVAV